MILAGLKLTFLGMGVVAIFLLLLILLINISYKLLAGGSEREFAEMEATEQLRKRKKPTLATGDEVLVAIITAAIARHRART